MKVKNKTVKVVLAVLFAACSAFCFALYGCGETSNDWHPDERTIEIVGAYDFTCNCELKEKQTFTSAEEIAETISSISRGAVKSESVVTSVIVENSAIYRITVKGISENADIREYFETLETDYMARFDSWKTFPNSPVKYTTKDGKDVLVYVSTENAENSEIDIYVFFFDAGAVDVIAARMDGSGGGAGGHGGAGGEGGQGGQSGQDKTVEITVNYNGSTETRTFTDGETVYISQIIYGKEVSLYADFSVILGEYDFIVARDGLIVYVRDKQQTPTRIVLQAYDVDKEGNLTPFENTEYAYGAVMKFNWAGFVLYKDKDCTQEIDPNVEITLTENTTVYRKDNLDRVPVFFHVHCFTNGVEEDISGQNYYFRGELLKAGRSFVAGYEFYYDRGGSQKMFEDGNVVVVRESDDKKDVYGFKEEESVAKVTFKLGGNDLCTVLYGKGYPIGEWCYLYMGTTTYHVTDCDVGLDYVINQDVEITITKFEKTSNYTVTTHLCYNGDIKSTYYNYMPIDGEPWEIGEDMGFYTDVNCTQIYTGTVTSSTVFYQPYYVNFDRPVGN